MFGLHVLVDRKSSPIVFGCKCFIAWIKWIYELILTYKASHGVFEIVPEFVLFAIQMPILLKVSKEEQCREPPSPSPGASLTTGYNLTCVPLLTGVPVPPPLHLAPGDTSATVTGLLPGAPYDCSIFTITDDGMSQPSTLSLLTTEIGMCTQ